METNREKLESHYWGKPMLIDKLDVYYVEMPMAYSWRTAYGEDSVSHSVLMKATSTTPHKITGP